VRRKAPPGILPDVARVVWHLVDQARVPDVPA